MNTLPPVPLQISNYVWVLGISSYLSSKEIRIFFRVKDLARSKKLDWILTILGLLAGTD